MSAVKGRVSIIGDNGQYAKLDDMVFPNPHSDRMGEIEWQLRHGSGELNRIDQLYAASIIEAYREIVLRKTAKERQYACSAIKWTGSITEADLRADHPTDSAEGGDQ